MSEIIRASTIHKSKYSPALHDIRLHVRQWSQKIIMEPRYVVGYTM